MIRAAHPDQSALFGPKGFATPFGSGLDANNRWIRWAHQIPWAELAAVYHTTLKTGGRPAKPARLNHNLSAPSGSTATAQKKESGITTPMIPPHPPACPH